MAFLNNKKHGEALEPADPNEAKLIPILNEEIAVVTDPRSSIAEQFRALRNSIHALNPDGAPRTVVVTSATRGEGKTTATINLACAMAELPGIRVLVVDGDLHSPSVERSLGLPRRQGLTEVLRGTCSVDRAVRGTSVPDLSILGAGELPYNPSEHLGSDRMRTLLGGLKQRFSYVLIDTPEALSISDASLLGAMADGVIMVVRLGVTPRYHVEQTHNLLESLGGNVLGTCLTGAGGQPASRNYARR